jgi:hypothetical protein
MKRSRQQEEHFAHASSVCYSGSFGFHSPQPNGTHCLVDNTSFPLSFSPNMMTKRARDRSIPIGK